MKNVTEKVNGSFVEGVQEKKYFFVILQNLFKLVFAKLRLSVFYPPSSLMIIMTGSKFRVAGSHEKRLES